MENEPVVNADPAWETSKENLQPVKAGRSVTALKQATGLVSSDHQTVREATDAFEAQRKSFEDELASDENNDKLGIWVQYLKWYQTALPAQSKQTEIVPLLERCTNDLFNVPEYKRDVRMLRIWIQYADLVKDPEDIFRFLQVHAIGQEFALYYEAYALCLEKRGSHKDAMAVYELGISNFAMPLDRLRKKLTAFHKRMAKRVERDARRSLQATPMNHNLQESRQRQALSSIQRPGTLFSSHQGVQPSMFQTPVNTSSSAQGRSNDNEIRIYTDTPSDLNNAPSSIARNALSTISQGGDEKGQSEAQLDWARLQRQEDLSKENEQKPSKWNQCSITQSNSGSTGMQQQWSTPNVAALEVLVDEEFEEPTPFALQQRPGNVREVAEGRTRGSTRKPKVKPSKTIMEYDEARVKDEITGEDVSFEERRAAMAFNRMVTNDKVSSSANDDMLAGAVDQLSSLEIAGGASHVEESVPEECSSQGADIGIASPRAATEDVTLYTKEAFETIDAMFTSQNTNTQMRKTKPAHLLDLGESDAKAPLSHRVSQKLDFGGHSVAADAGASDLEIYEDTTILPSTSIAVSAQNDDDLGPQQVFPKEAAAGFLFEHNGDKENLEGEGQPSASCAGVRANEGGMPQEMGKEELFARGIEIGNGLPSDEDDDDIFERDENLLELPAERLSSFIPDDETDDFQVYCDE